MADKRICKGCGQPFPLTTKHFYKRAGYFYRKCISCYLADCKAYRDANRETRNQKASEYGKSEHGKAQRRAYYARKRDHINEVRRRWALRHYSRLAAKAKARRLRARQRYFQKVSTSIEARG